LTDISITNKPTINQVVAMVAPGTVLREGIERILKAHMGALIVIGDSKEVLEICTGGFVIDSPLTAQRLSELAKMDGAIILSKSTRRISRANVQLVPNPDIPTSETGTRHRTAERVARSLEIPVIAVSEDLGTVTLYCGSDIRVLEPVSTLWNRANQLLQTLERFKTRFDLSLASLSALEVSDLVTVKDVSSVIQRAEMVKRVAKRAEEDIFQLGKDGTLLSMQLIELTEGIDKEELLVIRDYAASSDRHSALVKVKELEKLSTKALLDLKEVASVVLSRGHEDIDLDDNLSARGNRLLSHIPRLPFAIVESIVNYFGTLQRIMRATEDDLGEVAGVGEARARNVKQGLSKLTEASIIDRYT